MRGVRTLALATVKSGRRAAGRKKAETQKRQNAETIDIVQRRQGRAAKTQKREPRAASRLFVGRSVVGKMGSWGGRRQSTVKTSTIKIGRAFCDSTGVVDPKCPSRTWNGLSIGRAEKWSSLGRGVGGVDGGGRCGHGGLGPAREGPMGQIGLDCRLCGLAEARFTRQRG